MVKKFRPIKYDPDKLTYSLKLMIIFTLINDNCIGRYEKKNH